MLNLNKLLFLSFPIVLFVNGQSQDDSRSDEYDGQLKSYGGNNGNNGEGVSVSQTCTNGVCRSCVNGVCYPRNFNSIKTYPTCPIVACNNNCNNFVVFTDNCPICSCNGIGTRQPCNAHSECSADAKCRDNVCTYSAVPSNLPTACDFDFQCKSDQSCKNAKCVAGAAAAKHVENVACIFHHQCPSGYNCRSMTCYQGDGRESDHEHGVACVFDHQCSSQYQCVNMSCIRTGRKHGTSSCVFSTSCNPDEECVNMTCMSQTNA